MEINGEEVNVNEIPANPEVTIQEWLEFWSRVQLQCNHQPVQFLRAHAKTEDDFVKLGAIVFGIPGDAGENLRVDWDKRIAPFFLQRLAQKLKKVDNKEYVF